MVAAIPGHVIAICDRPRWLPQKKQSQWEKWDSLNDHIVHLVTTVFAEQAWQKKVATLGVTPLTTALPSNRIVVTIVVGSRGLPVKT